MMMSDDPRLVGDRLQFDVDLAKPLLPARAMRQRRVRPLCERFAAVGSEAKFCRVDCANNTAELSPELLIVLK